MAELIYNDPDRLKAWATEHYEDAAVDGDTHAMGMEIGGKLAAVVLYNGFTRWECNIHVVTDGSRRWCSRGFLAAVFAYPFRQLGLQRVTALVPAKNTDALVLDLRLGFVPEGVKRAAYGDDDIVVLGMTRGSCKWLPEE